MPTQRPLIHLLCSADHNLLQRAAVSHSSGRPLAATDRLVRALTTCTVSPCRQAPQHTPPSRPSSRSWGPPSTACTPGQRWTTSVGPSAWRATQTVTARSQPLVSSLAPHVPFPCAHVASGVQAPSTGVQGECCVA